MPPNTSHTHDPAIIRTIPFYQHLLAQLTTMPRSAHAFLCIAAPGSGFETMIQFCEEDVRKTYPDLRIIRIEAEKAEGRYKDISITEVRALKSTLSLSATQLQIVIISQADMLTQEAANALLKIIEEPPRDTLFILHAPSRESVIATIASRCQWIQCRYSFTDCTEPLCTYAPFFYTETGSTETPLWKSTEINPDLADVSRQILEYNEHTFATLETTLRANAIFFARNNKAAARVVGMTDAYILAKQYRDRNMGVQSAVDRIFI